LPRLNLAASLFLPCVLTSSVISAQTAAPAGIKPWTVHDMYYEHGSGAGSPADTEWMPDGTMLSYILPDGSLGVINAKTGQRKVLTAGAMLAGIDKRPVNEQDRDHRARYQQPNYFWSPDGSQVLFDEDGTLWLDTIATHHVRQIGDSGQGSGDDVKFSPDGQAISYIHDHNLYIQREGKTSVALTHTTDPNLRNGETDWVYLEELDVRTNYSWSPDSKKLEYLQMDETKVPTYPITDWIPTHPTIDEQKYPQPGDPNPAVRVGIVSADGGATQWVDLPEVRPNEDYIPRSGWVNANTVWIEVLHRDHKERDIWFANAQTGKAELALAMTDPKFFDENYNVDFFAPGKVLLRSWHTGYMHLDYYTYDGNAPHTLTLTRQLEHGEYTVEKMLSVEGNTVYYQSNEGAPLDQQIWAVNLNGSNKHKVSNEAGVHRAEFAEGHSSYVDDFSNLSTPPRIDICTVGSACLNLWKDAPLKDHVYRKPIMLTLKAADGKTILYGSLLLPERKTETASVPLINNPYGGPEAQTVTNGWGGGTSPFDQLLTEHGFAVLHVDNRGMANRGRAFEQSCYRDFGKVQLADQLAAIDQVLAKYPQLDPKRLGWWGWSWGVHTQRSHAFRPLPRRRFGCTGY
jgi:dipeptidyl-peptidase-4